MIPKDIKTHTHTKDRKQDKKQGKIGVQDSLKIIYEIIQFSLVAQSCPTLCEPMNCNTPSLPVHHQLPEFTQTHVHRVMGT